MEYDVDDSEITASDFAIIGRGLPIKKSSEEIKKKFEEEFADDGVEIAYINYCYDIEDFIKAS